MRAGQKGGDMRAVLAISSLICAKYLKGYSEAVCATALKVVVDRKAGLKKLQVELVGLHAVRLDAGPASLLQSKRTDQLSGSLVNPKANRLSHEDLSQIFGKAGLGKDSVISKWKISTQRCYRRMRSS